MFRRWRQRRLFRRLGLAEAAAVLPLVDAERTKIGVLIDGFKDELRNLAGIDHFCPQCGARLLIRIAYDTGNEFWGCSSWPACSYTARIGQSPRTTRGFNA